MMPEFKVGDKWVSYHFGDYFTVTSVTGGTDISWNTGELKSAITEQWWDYWGQTYQLDELQQVINILKDYE
jgi:hypothetical protein